MILHLNLGFWQDMQRQLGEQSVGDQVQPLETATGSPLTVAPTGGLAPCSVPGGVVSPFHGTAND